MDRDNKIVNVWLKQRQEILKILNNLARLLPSTYSYPVSLAYFFQLLIDYTCAGHLRIFNDYLKRYDNCTSVMQILKQINNSTDFIIKINSKFNKFNNISAQDIVVLLEKFADRIESEDILLGMKVANKHQIN